MDDHRPQISEFNAASTLIERCDFHLRLLTQYRQSGQFGELARTLRSFYLEICPFLSETEDSEAIKALNQCDKFTSIITGSNATMRLDPAIFAVFFTTERMLRRMMHTHHLYAKMQEDPAGRF